MEYLELLDRGGFTLPCPDNFASTLAPVLMLCFADPSVKEPAMVELALAVTFQSTNPFIATPVKVGGSTEDRKSQVHSRASKVRLIDETALLFEFELASLKENWLPVCEKVSQLGNE